MDASELARKMLEWQEKRLELDAIEDVIKDAVLDLKTTQTVGNVRASYFKGRGIYDYQSACHAAGYSDDRLEAYKVVLYDYKKAAGDFELNMDKYYLPGTPSVSIKILKEKERK